MEPIDVTHHEQLRPLTLGDAHTLRAVLDEHRTHLDPWLRWSGAIRTDQDAATFIEESTQRLADGNGFHLGLWRKEELLGGVICWYIDNTHRNAEVGYWLVPAERGRGLASTATQTIVEHLFRNVQLHRVELQCAVTNAPSRRLAERLGFEFEGIRRQSHWLNTQFVDHAVYGALASEWQKRQLTPFP